MCCEAHRFVFFRRALLKSVLGVLLGLGLVGVATPTAPLAADCNLNQIADTLEPDTDADGVPDACDNCVLTANPLQVDSNEDGTGNFCDPDLDNDQVVGLADFNVFRSCFGTAQADCDFDGDGTVGLSDFSILGEYFGGIKERGRQSTGILRGFIAVSQMDPMGVRLRDIYLPSVEVYLLNTLTGVEPGSTHTDLSGRFTLYAYTPGYYQICWRAAGIQDGCSTEIYPTPALPVYVSTFRVGLVSDPGHVAVFGRVEQADGSAVRNLHALTSLNTTAKVLLRNGAEEELSRVYVNNHGYYFLPNVPTGQAFSLVVALENAETVRNVSTDAQLASAPLHQIDLRLENRAPRVYPVVAMSDGARVRTALPGSVVSLAASAEDPDGDPLEYSWFVSSGSGSLETADEVSTKWSLPAENGLFSVQLRVSDGRGGYARSNLSLRVGDSGVLFRGRVLEPGGTPVMSAEIEVNGMATTSGAAGNFELWVPDVGRFVFNIRALGYGLLSQIYDDAVEGGIWTLNPASVFVGLDPKADIELTHVRTPDNCPGPLSFKQDYETFPSIEEPVWQDGNGNVVAPFEGALPGPLPGPDSSYSTGCPDGIQVKIPANSLVDQYGNPPPELVNVTLSTVDLNSPFQMPGDYTVALTGGDEGVMESFGAGGISVSAEGKEYNLADGTTAEVTIPVDSTQLVAPEPLDPTVPVLYYDETLGTWSQDGEAALVGSAYQYQASHFSEINMDRVRDGEACVRVLSEDLPASFDLEIMIPLGDAAPIRLTLPIENSTPREHVIYNLPTDTNIVLIPVRRRSQAPIGTFIVNTGAPQASPNARPPAGPPYESCSTQVRLYDRVIPAYPSSGAFLNGLYSFDAVNLDELDVSDPTLANQVRSASAAYYSKIDPCRRRETLEEFKTTNQFDENVGTQAHAIFANSGDLGLGRDMTCRRTDSNVACYVTNFGNIDRDDIIDVADAVISAEFGRPGVTTVAMEYSPIETGQFPDCNVIEYEDPESVVKFYVYDGLTGELELSANLDNVGERPVPQLCMACHGGVYPGGVIGRERPLIPWFLDSESVKLGSRFIPFDLSTYTFDTIEGQTKEDQQEEFRALNYLIQDAPLNAVISEVIAGMYSGPDPLVQNEDFVVEGWDDTELEREMYKDVIAPSCRACHIALPFRGLQFDTSDGFKALLAVSEIRVCDQNVMPHAKVTHDLFWGSLDPHKPSLFQAYGDAFAADPAAGGWSGQLCGDFTPGGETPLPQYEAEIQPIYDAYCIRCHAVDALPPNLTIGNSWDQTVGVPSLQVPGLDLIEDAPGAGIDPKEASYLWHMLNGSFAGVGGVGPRMPKDEPPLPAGAVTVILNWIDDGATED